MRRDAGGLARGGNGAAQEDGERGAEGGEVAVGVDVDDVALEQGEFGVGVDGAGGDESAGGADDAGVGAGGDGEGGVAFEAEAAVVDAQAEGEGEDAVGAERLHEVAFDGDALGAVGRGDDAVGRGREGEEGTGLAGVGGEERELLAQARGDGVGGGEAGVVGGFGGVVAEEAEAGGDELTRDDVGGLAGDALGRARAEADDALAEADGFGGDADERGRGGDGLRAEDGLGFLRDELDVEGEEDVERARGGVAWAEP